MIVQRRGLWVLFLILITALAARLFFLRTAPALFSHDELHYISEAQAIAISGSDLTGSWRPWQLRPTNPLYAELPSTIMSIGSLLFSDVFLKARAMHILLGILLPVILGGIGWKLTNSRSVFWLTLLLGLVNPWLYQFSRMSFDALFSLFFYSTGVLLLIWLPSKWRLLSIVSLLIGFYQYQGLKIIFLPLVFSTLGYVWWTELPADKKIKLKSVWQKLHRQQWDLLIVGIFSVLLFGWFLTKLPTQSASQRVNDIIFFNDTYLSAKVNDQRLLSLTDPFGKYSVNKLSVMLHEFFIKYAQTFDPSQLFVRGESVRNPFSVWTQGMFYTIDVLLIAAGAYALIRTTTLRKSALLLLAFALLAPLPVAINSIDTWVMFRGSWLVVTLLVVMGIGADFLRRHLSTGWARVLLMGIMVAYGISLLNFASEYFYRYPIYSTKGTQFAERVLASYLERLPQDKQVVVLVDEARFVFESYLVYNNLINDANLPAIRQAMQTSVYRLDNVTFTTDCLNTAAFRDDLVVINNSANVTCDQQPVPSLQQPYAKIPSLLDNGSQFTIYNDPVCSKYALKPFIHVTDRKVLDVERLENQAFCDQLFSKPIE